jgi:hypothetical protein
MQNRTILSLFAIYKYRIYIPVMHIHIYRIIYRIIIPVMHHVSSIAHGSDWNWTAHASIVPKEERVRAGDASLHAKVVGEPGSQSRHVHPGARIATRALGYPKPLSPMGTPLCTCPSPG